jgi:hypothetical protein
MARAIRIVDVMEFDVELIDVREHAVGREKERIPGRLTELEAIVLMHPNVQAT